MLSPHTEVNNKLQEEMAMLRLENNVLKETLKLKLKSHNGTGGTFLPAGGTAGPTVGVYAADHPVHNDMHLLALR